MSLDLLEGLAKAVPARLAVDAAGLSWLVAGTELGHWFLPLLSGVVDFRGLPDLPPRSRERVGQVRFEIGRETALVSSRSGLVSSRSVLTDTNPPT